MQKADVKKYMKQESFVASKKMGQNFLVNLDIKKRIVNAADVDKQTLVVEIGPGLGAITELILEKGYRLLAIELDKRLYAHLKERFHLNPDFYIVNDDFLELNLVKSIYGLPIPSFNKICVIANLPYSISSKIILKFILIPEINQAVIMVQKEMAQRLCAKVNSNDYNALTVLVALFYETKILFDVGPKNFVPQPKVDSSVLKLVRKDFQLEEKTLTDLISFIRLVFQNRRKTLFNNLRIKYAKQTILDVLALFGLNEKTRAQELEPELLYQLFLAIFLKN